MLSFGGQGLPNYSSHQTDMFRYLLGDENCRWVMGNVERKTDRFERTTRIEDRAVAVFEFDERRAGAYPGRRHGHCLSGRAHLRHGGPDQPHHRRGPAPERRDRRRVWRSHRPDGRFFKVEAEGEKFEWLEGGAAQADELADWITGVSNTHRGRAENGYKALEMIHASLRVGSLPRARDAAAPDPRQSARSDG